MKTTTVKTVEQVLLWIDSHDHHFFDTHYRRGQWRNGERIANDEPSHAVLAGHHERIRIPIEIYKQIGEKMEPNPRKFDTRMFHTTKHGREWLRQKMKAATQARVASGEPTIFEELVAEGTLRG